MKKFFIIAGMALLAACNNSNSGKENNTPDTATSTQPSTGNTTTPATTAGAATITYTPAGGSEKTVRASVLVQADKDKLSPGNDKFAMITANGDDQQNFVMNFLFALKPGTYPVVGLALSSPKQVFGGLLGGKPAITGYNVNLTECNNIGDNQMGGHKWRISGSVDGDVVIKAMNMMKFDTTHPASITVSKISFSNLTFDDNWEQVLEQGMKRMNK